MYVLAAWHCTVVMADTCVPSTYVACCPCFKLALMHVNPLQHSSPHQAQQCVPLAVMKLLVYMSGLSLCRMKLSRLAADLQKP